MLAAFEEMAEQNNKILISDIEEGVLHVVTFLDFAFGPRGPCPSKKHFLQKSAAICSPQGRHTVAECQTNSTSKLVKIVCEGEKLLIGFHGINP